MRKTATFAPVRPLRWCVHARSMRLAAPIAAPVHRLAAPIAAPAHRRCFLRYSRRWFTAGPTGGQLATEWYRRLQLPVGASREQVKAQYFKLAKQLHPGACHRAMVICRQKNWSHMAQHFGPVKWPGTGVGLWSTHNRHCLLHLGRTPLLPCIRCRCQVGADHRAEYCGAEQQRAFRPTH